ncbi:MAG: hypothetical protein K0R38_2017 [Polyangiaceae bacterium]|nr:hypothetical protein [Polyangiaceae bacterium]
MPRGERHGGPTQATPAMKRMCDDRDVSDCIVPHLVPSQREQLGKPQLTEETHARVQNVGDASCFWNVVAAVRVEEQASEPCVFCAHIVRRE